MEHGAWSWSTEEEVEVRRVGDEDRGTNKQRAVPGTGRNSQEKGTSSWKTGDMADIKVVVAWGTQEQLGYQRERIEEGRGGEEG